MLAGLAAYRTLDSAALLAQGEPGALEKAQARARRTAALPPPEFRTHAAGLVLSKGAEDAARSCSGDACVRAQRFVAAVGEVRRLAESGGCVVQHCPDAVGSGLRPLPYTPHAFGNRCEPLWNRGAVEVVRQLVGADWRGLEWHTGSSTSWLLARLGHLTSIEAAPGAWGDWRGG